MRLVSALILIGACRADQGYNDLSVDTGDGADLASEPATDTDPAVDPGSEALTHLDPAELCAPAFDFSACASLAPYAGPAPAVSWTYDQVGSTDVTDGAGSLHGSFVGAPTVVPGVLGQGLAFDGSSWVTAARHADLNLGSFTLMTWVKTAGGDRYDFIMSTGNGMPAWTGAGLMLDGANLAALLEGGNGGAEAIVGGGQLCAGLWTHVALSFDAGQVTLYADGVVVGARALPYAAITYGAQPFAVGNDPNNTTRFLTGAVDETLVFNEALGESAVNDVIAQQLCGSW